MRSVSVVLPESMWAEMPMFLSFARSFMDVVAGKWDWETDETPHAAYKRPLRIQKYFVTRIKNS